MTPRALLTAFFFCLVAGPAFAQSGSGFYLPVAPTSYGQDEFRAADGTTCRSSMDGTKRVEVGAFGSGGKADDNNYALPGYTYAGNQGRTAGVYGRFSMSLDASPDRMNCNTLYKLELERRALELELMKRSLVDADRRLDQLKQSRAEESAGEPEHTASISRSPVAKTAAKTPAKAPANTSAKTPAAKTAAKPSGKPAKTAAAKQTGAYPPP